MGSKVKRYLYLFLILLFIFTTSTIFRKCDTFICTSIRKFPNFILIFFSGFSFYFLSIKNNNRIKVGLIEVNTIVTTTFIVGTLINQGFLHPPLTIPKIQYIFMSPFAWAYLVENIMAITSGYLIGLLIYTIILKIKKINNSSK